MRDLDLDAVEPAFDLVAGGDCERRDGRADVVLVHRLGRVRAGRLGHLRRRPQQERRLLGARVAPVGELREDRHALRVHRVRHRPVRGHDGGIPRVDEAPRHLAARVHRLALGDDQPDAAAGPLRVVRGVVVGRAAGGGAERREVGEEDDPVGELHSPDGERLEDVRKGGRAHRDRGDDRAQVGEAAARRVLRTRWADVLLDDEPLRRARGADDRLEVQQAGAEHGVEACDALVVGRDGRLGRREVVLAVHERAARAVALQRRRRGRGRRRAPSRRRARPRAAPGPRPPG